MRLSRLAAAGAAGALLLGLPLAAPTFAAEPTTPATPTPVAGPDPSKTYYANENVVLYEGFLRYVSSTTTDTLSVGGCDPANGEESTVDLYASDHPAPAWDDAVLIGSKPTKAESDGIRDMHFARFDLKVPEVLAALGKSEVSALYFGAVCRKADGRNEVGVSVSEGGTSADPFVKAHYLWKNWPPTMTFTRPTSNADGTTTFTFTLTGFTPDNVDPAVNKDFEENHKYSIRVRLFDTDLYDEVDAVRRGLLGGPGIQEWYDQGDVVDVTNSGCAGDNCVIDVTDGVATATITIPSDLHDGEWQVWLTAYPLDTHFTFLFDDVNGTFSDWTFTKSGSTITVPGASETPAPTPGTPAGEDTSANGTNTPTTTATPSTATPTTSTTPTKGAATTKGQKATKAATTAKAPSGLAATGVTRETALVAGLAAGLFGLGTLMVSRSSRRR